MSANLVSLPAALIEDFEFLEDWSARYAYLIELGEKLPLMEEQHRTEDNRVKGCMSQVWVEAVARPDGHVDFVGDCDTAIIKGILAVLIELMSGLTPREIESLDLNPVLCTEERCVIADARIILKKNDN